MRHTAKTARRTVQIALAGAAVIVLAVIIERTSFEQAERNAMLKLLADERAASAIVSANERQAMAANMAVATNDPSWISAYESSIADTRAAFDHAQNLATTPASRASYAKARDANDRLLHIDNYAFKELAQGNVKAARRVLDSGLYKHHREILADSTVRFFESNVAAVHQDMLRLQRRTTIALPLIIVICGLGAYALWYRLNVSLNESQAAFARAERTIRNLAMNDSLTGLANRRAMFIELKDALQQARHDEANVALLMIDLDRFKPVNDENGHLVGDQVLKQVGHRLAGALPNAQVQARYGGDEFLAALRCDGNDETVRCACEQVIEALRQPMSVDGVQMQIGASVGSALFPRDADTGEELIRKADLALRHAKQHARGTASAYVVSLDRETEDRHKLETELRDAIAEEALLPYFQPVVDLRTGKVRGFEILCRWQHPEHGLMLPDTFIPLAESAGLIGDLTISLLRAACRSMQGMPRELVLAINITPQQIQDPALAHQILAVLSSTDFSPLRLEVELTENALVTDLPAAKRVIESLKQLGIRVALDDFGTGYSSLSYLADLPIDLIKIDRSFIRHMRDQEQSTKIVSAIIGLGKSLHLSTIAEGVECESDADFLRSKGCTLAQGNHFGRPMPLAEAAALVGVKRPKSQLVA